MEQANERADFIYIIPEQCLGKIISLGAFVSLVEYYKGGIKHEVYMDNDEFIERGSIGYEEE